MALPKIAELLRVFEGRVVRHGELRGRLRQAAIALAGSSSYVHDRAVLSMDLWTAIVSNYTKNRPDLVQRASSVWKEARRLGMIIFHVRVGFRHKLPEISSRNLLQHQGAL